MPHGMGHFGHGGRGGRGGRNDEDGDSRRSGHPVFSTDRRGTRHRFREFIAENGVFGRGKQDNKDTDAGEETKDGNGSSREAKASPADTPANDRDSKRKSHEPRHGSWYYLRQYLSLLRSQRGRLALILLASPLLVALHALQPLSSKHIIDHILIPKLGLETLVYTCVDLATAIIIWVGLSLVHDYLIQSMMGNLAVTVKRRMMKHLQQLPLSRLQEMKVGGIISRLQSDTEQMVGLLNHAVLSPYKAILMLCLGIGSLVVLSLPLTVICLTFSISVIGLSFLFFNRMRPFRRMLRRDLASITGHLTETFGGVQVVRAFARERTEARAYAGETHLLWRKSLYANILNMLLHRSIWMIHGLIVVAIWAVGGYYVTIDEMQIGDLVAFTMFIGWLFHPIFMIMGSFSQMQNSFACAERIFDLLDEEPGMADSEDALAVEAIRESIQLENVTFNYPDGTRALSDVNLTIPCGKVTALVGPSGAGKTTITHLVMRFYDPTEGRVLLDGTDLLDLRLSPYRKLIGLVLQEIFLFDGTIRENITYGRLGADEEQVKYAAELANCTEFINNLDKGFDTVIGERGVKLSVGQKQRLALARALLSNPQVLILDEATSNLDSESEALIQDALQAIFHTRTTLVIAHRLSTIMDADNIVVVDKGRIAEQGTHDELLAREGRYFDLYTKQMEKTERRSQIFDWNDGEEDNAEGNDA